MCYSGLREDVISISYLKYIEQNIKEDISLVDLLEMIHYSPWQIYYMIKETTGMPA